MRLLLVESPAKARTLDALMGPEFLVRATRGHIRDLPGSGLGIDPRKGFRPQWRALPTAREEMAAIESEAFLCGEILLATDPDREGESIAAHLAERFRRTRRPCRRVRISELTHAAVAKAISEAGDINRPLVEAQTARRVLDRLIGYTVSPSLAASTEGRAATGIGRAAAATLGLVRQRELHVEQPEPDPSWQVEIDWTAPDGRQIKTTLDTLFPDERTASARARGLAEVRATVASTTSRRTDGRPTTGPTTYDLLIRASTDSGFTAPDVMRAAQRLYEGIPRPDLPPLALISYPRTDDTAIPLSVFVAARNFLDARFGIPHPPTIPDIQPAQTHGSIRPLDFEHDPERVRPYLSPVEYRIYTLIWESTLAACAGAFPTDSHAPERLQLDSPHGRIGVNASGRRTDGSGPDASFSPAHAPGQDPRSGTFVPGDELAATEIRVRPEVSPKSAPHNDGTLVEAMRSAGIARPSTCASTIQALVDRGYTRRERHGMQTTRLGRHVLDVLDEQFPGLTNPSFTQRMEDDLDAIAEGRTTYEDVVSAFYDSWVLPALSSRHGPQRTPDPGTDTPEHPPAASARCPDCGRPLVARTGRFGAFLGCTGYPTCRFTRPAV